MRRQSTHDVGARYEEKATAYLSAAGIEILTRDFYCRGGEVDLIGSNGRCLIFFGAKHRSSRKDGLPLSTISSMKQRRLFLAARQYLYRQHLPESTPVRFDAVEVLGEELIWLQDAFRETRPQLTVDARHTWVYIGGKGKKCITQQTTSFPPGNLRQGIR